MTRRGRRWGLVALGAILVAGAVLGFGGRLLRASGVRLLLVGLDGADWEILEPLLASGQMPHLRSLVERGSSGRLKSIEPLISPPIWTSIATGVKPERHGITWFLCDTERPGERIPVTSTLREAKAFWNILSEHGKRVGVVGWWATYPAERVRGFVLSDFVGYHGFGNTGRSVETDLGKAYPPTLLREIEPLLPDPTRISYEQIRRFLSIEREEFEGALRGEGWFAGPISLFVSYLATAESYARIGERLAPAYRSEVLAVYFELPDAASHLFARFAPPRRGGISQEGWDRFSGTVEAVYGYQDELLGRLLGLVGSDGCVLVVSDHGFRWGEDRPDEGDLVEIGKAHYWHRREGIFVAAGPGIRRGHRLENASVLDIAPTLLRYLGAPVARDLDGSPLVDLFEAEWVEEHPATFADSYGRPRKEGTGDPFEGGARAFAEEQERRLAALGYLSRSGASPEMRASRARLFLEENRVEEAEEELKNLLRQAPADLSVRVVLAEIYRATGRSLLARKEYEAAAGLAPNDVRVLCGLAELLAEQGDLEGAEARLEEALGADADSLGAHLLLGHVFNRQGRIAEARIEFERVLSIQSDCALALYNLGVIDEREGHFATAEERYRDAARLAPRDPYSRMNLGVLLAKRGDHEDAIRILSEAASLSPRNAEVRYNLGLSCLDQGMPEKAIEEFEAALDCDPDLRWAHFSLGRAEALTGNPEKALKSFAIAARLDPRDPESRYAIAVVEASLGHPDRARAFLREAMALGGLEIRERAVEDPLLSPLLEPARPR